MDDRERGELLALREEVAQLRARVGAVRVGRESARAALNLMEDALAARREAEAASRAKDEFLAVVSHELRTPLAAITLWSQALRGGRATHDQVERAIASIEQSASFQSRLIDDILDLSRLGSGKVTLARQAVDLRSHVESAIEAVEPLATPKRIAIANETDGDLGWSMLDGTRLMQVLWNLLTNAIKFTQEGGHVRIAARVLAKTLEVDVVDDGEGIAPEFLPHVFDRFRQADMSASRRQVGLGIGLTLVKELVELHGGTIDVKSDGLGRGAAFHVVLPRIEAAPTRARDDLATPSLEMLRVLLVEDDASTRAAMVWTLEGAGAIVSAVSNARDALEGIERADVLVSDLGLPGMSGIELVEQAARSFRDRGASPLPSCAISAHTRDVDRRGAIDAGFDIFLTKPVSAEQLIEAVADLRAML